MAGDFLLKLEISQKTALTHREYLARAMNLYQMKEIRRLYVVQQIEGRQMTGRQGAELLGLSLRQMRRLLAKYRQQRAQGLAWSSAGWVTKSNK